MLSEEQLLLSQLAKLFSLLPHPKVQLLKLSLYEKVPAMQPETPISPKLPKLPHFSCFSSRLQLFFFFQTIEIHLIITVTTKNCRFWPDLTCRAHTIARNNLRQGFLGGSRSSRSLGSFLHKISKRKSWLRFQHCSERGRSSGFVSRSDIVVFPAPNIAVALRNHKYISSLS